jgi:hypothetical protein
LGAPEHDTAETATATAISHEPGEVTFVV